MRRRALDDGQGPPARPRARDANAGEARHIARAARAKGIPAAGRDDLRAAALVAALAERARGIARRLLLEFGAGVAIGEIALLRGEQGRVDAFVAPLIDRARACAARSAGAARDRAGASAATRRASSERGSRCHDHGAHHNHDCGVTAASAARPQARASRRSRSCRCPARGWSASPGWRAAATIPGSPAPWPPPAAPRAPHPASR